jgi:DNA end-binding protein Ku
LNPCRVPSGEELALALQIVDSLSGKWDPSKYQDTFRERLIKLVDEKAKGGEIAVEPEREQGGEIVDLLAALKASLAKGKGEQKGPGHARSRPGRRGKPRTTSPARASARRQSSR